MGNTLIKQGRPFVEQSDMKVMAPKTPAEWQKIAKANHCISLDDRCLTTDLCKWLLYHFPDESPYECNARPVNLIDLVNPTCKRAVSFRRTRDLVRR